MRIITLKLAIQSWCAWQPETGGRTRCLSFRGGSYETIDVEKPALAGIPPMQKRRLSPLARIVFHVLAQCTSEESDGPLVFSSYMGEIKRTQGILDAIAAGDGVSPAAFSLSVHNAISGLWSLIHGNTAPMIAVAPTGNSPVAALIEAAGIIAEGKYSSVCVVFYEEDYPAFYDPFLASPAAPYALAMQFVSDTDSDNGATEFELHSLPGEGDGQKMAGPMVLLDVLLGKTMSVRLAEPQCHWRLDRCG